MKADLASVTLEDGMKCFHLGLCASLILIFATFEVHPAQSVSSVGFGYGFFQGPGSKNLAPGYAPGVDYFTTWSTSKRVDLVSKVELATLAGGDRFGSTGSPFFGFGLMYAFQPRFYITPEGQFQPYVCLGPTLGAFGVLLTNLSVGNDVSNNQVSLKYGLNLSIGADFKKKFNFTMEYFYYFPSPSIFQFQAGKIDARGVHITIGWMYDSPRGK